MRVVLTAHNAMGRVTSEIGGTVATLDMGPAQVTLDPGQLLR